MPYTLIRNGTLIDGNGDAPLPNAAVLIQDNRIKAVGATTKIAAKCLGWQDRVGTIEAGKLADVVVTKANPLADIRSLEKQDNIVMVMKDGKVVKGRREE